MLHIQNCARSHSRPSQVCRSRAIKPSLEALEDRTVPSTLSNGFLMEAATSTTAAVTSLTETIRDQGSLTAAAWSSLAQTQGQQLTAPSLATNWIGMTESAIAADLGILQAWSTAMTGLLLGGSNASSAVTPSAPAAAPSAPATSQAAAVSVAAAGAQTGAVVPELSTSGTISTIGQFTNVATPFTGTEGTMTAVPGGVYFASGTTLWFLNETTGVWSAPRAIATTHPVDLMRLPNGNLAFQDGVGNIDLGHGTTPGQFAVVNPTTGATQVSNLEAGYIARGGVVAGNGSILAVTSWSGWLAGHSASKVEQGVWTSPDGAHFSLLSTVPGAGALWFLSKATDGSNRLFTGGENANGPWQSSDNGKTWQSLGLSSSAGFTGNNWGVLQLSDGTLLVQKRLKTSTGQYPLVRGKPGGPWAPSSNGLPPLQDVFSLIKAPTGALIAGVGSNSGGTAGGTYVSYDNGKNWTSLTSKGAPAVRTENIIATSTHVYIWPAGGPPMVAHL